MGGSCPLRCVLGILCALLWARRMTLQVVRDLIRSNSRNQRIPPWLHEVRTTLHYTGLYGGGSQARFPVLRYLLITDLVLGTGPEEGLIKLTPRVRR